LKKKNKQQLPTLKRCLYHPWLLLWGLPLHACHRLSSSLYQRVPKNKHFLSGFIKHGLVAVIQSVRILSWDFSEGNCFVKVESKKKIHLKRGYFQNKQPLRKFKLINVKVKVGLNHEQINNVVFHKWEHSPHMQLLSPEI